LGLSRQRTYSTARIRKEGKGIKNWEGTQGKRLKGACQRCANFKGKKQVRSRWKKSTKNEEREGVKVDVQINLGTDEIANYA